MPSPPEMLSSDHERGLVEFTPRIAAACSSEAAKLLRGTVDRWSTRRRLASGPAALAVAALPRVSTRLLVANKTRSNDGISSISVVLG